MRESCKSLENLETNLQNVEKERSLAYLFTVTLSSTEMPTRNQTLGAIEVQFKYNLSTVNIKCL